MIEFETEQYLPLKVKITAIEKGNPERFDEPGRTDYVGELEVYLPSRYEDLNVTDYIPSKIMEEIYSEASDYIFEYRLEQNTDDKLSLILCKRKIQEDS